MLILLGALVSLLLAWARGASPLQLGLIRLRYLPLPLVAYLGQLLAFRYLSGGAAPYALVIQLITGALVLAFVFANLRYRTLALVALGTGLNLAVISANGGLMPVRIADAERAGLSAVAQQLATEGRFEKSRPLDETTLLPWLADVIHVPLPGPDRLMSVGDLLVGVGVFLFLQEALLLVDSPRRSDYRPAPRA